MISSAAAQAVSLGLGAAVVWGISDFAGGYVTRRTFPAIVVAISHGLSLLFLLLLLTILHAGPPARATIGFGLISGASGSIGLMLFYEALALGAMGLTAAIAGVITALLPVLYSLFENGRPSIPQAAGFVLAVLAIWMIAYTPGDKPHPRGLGLAAASGVGFGLMLVLLEKAGTSGVGWAMTFSRLGGSSIAAVLAAITLIRRKGELAGNAAAGQHIRWGKVVPLAALAGAFDTAGNLFYTESALRYRLDVAAVLASLYPGITILLAAWLLRERTTRMQTAGMLLALAAVVLISA